MRFATRLIFSLRFHSWLSASMWRNSNSKAHIFCKIRIWWTAKRNGYACVCATIWPKMLCSHDIKIMTISVYIQAEWQHLFFGWQRSSQNSRLTTRYTPCITWPVTDRIFSVAPLTRARLAHTRVHCHFSHVWYVPAVQASPCGGLRDILRLHQQPHSVQSLCPTNETVGYFIPVNCDRLQINISPVHTASSGICVFSSRTISKTLYANRAHADSINLFKLVI